ncbi:hypothetical protein [Microbacterium sp. NPDC089696]|uniref:hypothetical protein n=1 Tax=Microbacterium sp. NPDC089696 TaxID=3364199 RepID=UPI003815D074
MNTLATPSTTLQDAIAKVVAEYATMKPDEYYELKPHEPFYEDHVAFDAINGDGPERTSFVQYYNQSGEEISGTWEEFKPLKLSRFQREHFKRTPNELLVGRTGVLIVSAGMWGRRPKPDGGFEYLPIDEYCQWRKAEDLRETRTAENRPAWAEEADPKPAWNVVDYIVRRGGFKYTQRLEADETMSAPSGFVSASFGSADELRALARQALDLAEHLERHERRLVRRPEVDERLGSLEP